MVLKIRNSLTRVICARPWTNVKTFSRLVYQTSIFSRKCYADLVYNINCYHSCSHYCQNINSAANNRLAKVVVNFSSTKPCTNPNVRKFSVGGCDKCSSSRSRTPQEEGECHSSLMIRNRSSGKRTSTLSLLDKLAMNQPLTVCVEGNIGSGKTTFLEHFKRYPEVCVFDEPISKWRDCQGYNLLDLMYKDPKKWSMCFQSYVQLTMLDLHTKPVAQPIKMMERSIYSAQYCFVKNLHDGGLLEEAQYSVLSEWFNFSTKNIPIKVDLIVYLRTDPEVAFTRTNQRGRSEENSISLEYIRSVHDLHEDWLVTKKHLLPCPVLTMDANLGLENMAKSYDECRKNMFQKVAVAN